MKYEEFLNLSLSEIVKYFSELNINKIQDIDDDNSFYKKCKISDIKKEDFHVFVGDHTLTNGCMTIYFKKEINDIKFNVKITFINIYKSSKNITLKCELEFVDYYSTRTGIRIYEKITDLYDKRENFNNIEMYYEPIYGNINKKLSEYYDEIIKYMTDIKPYIDEVNNMIDNGTFFEIFNKYNIRKFIIGHMQIYCGIFNILVEYKYNKVFDNYEDIIAYISYCYSNINPNIDDKKSYFIENIDKCKNELIDNVTIFNNKNIILEQIKNKLNISIDEICDELNINKSDIYFNINYNPK